MERRKALQAMGAIMGATLISSELFLSGCKADTSNGSAVAHSSIIDEHKALIASIADTILPATKKQPGIAATTGVATMMAILNDCYYDDAKQKFAIGLKAFASSLGDKKFDTLSLEERTKIIQPIDAKYFDTATKKEDKPYFYGLIKEASILSYFTDKKVMEEVLTYVKVPGKYDGEFKLTKGANMTVYGLGV
jgi:hypothetical protein